MKNLKRIFSLIMIFALMGTVLGGCAQRAEEDKDNVVDPPDSENNYGDNTNADEQNAGDDEAAQTTDPEEIDPEKYPLVTITMENDKQIKILLDPVAAPETVANFVTLINDKFYDGLTFHRFESGFVIQGGDPQGSGYGGPGYGILGEFAQNKIENNISHVRGVISMARSNDYNSAGSQFFITVGDATFLDGGYAAFGTVTEGMDVVDEICENGPSSPQVMKTVTVETYGIEYDKFTKY